MTTSSIFPITQSSFEVEDIETFKRKALQWADSFDRLVFFDNNGYKSQGAPAFEAMIAVGAEQELAHVSAGYGSEMTGFQKLKEWWQKDPGWVVGFLAYDLKNELEDLHSSNPDGLGLPDLHFFRPSILIRLKDNRVVIESRDQSPILVMDSIQSFSGNFSGIAVSRTEIRPRVSREEYLKTIRAIRAHIIEGDVYEMNFCQEFFAENACIDPLHTFRVLNNASPAPFAVYYRLKDRHLMCASPERFLKKRGERLLSQPIKGTISRGNNLEEDALRKKSLSQSEKDRAENVMIVDLVRNDLARSCLPGSVRVDELFGIHSFQQVHQMISTVSGKLRPELHFMDALAMAFPMGSMTGAPKVMSMQLIEHYEKTKRGLYSGAVGYISPEGDFDFNVVIRSLLYNAEDRYLSYQTGGAIVYDSDPVQEYEECLLKGSAIRQILSA
jgi:para-aminobenzoate synthetase component 1